MSPSEVRQASTILNYPHYSFSLDQNTAYKILRGLGRYGASIDDWVCITLL